jgi:hypothetical protein
MKGGFFEGLTNSLTNSLSELGNSLSNTTSSLGNSLKNTTTSMTNKLKSSMDSTSTPSYSAPPRSYGGKKRRCRSKKMRGGDFTDNTPTSGLAFHAAPFSGETARPNTWVGGKTKKRRRHSKRSKSHRKH